MTKPPLTPQAAYERRVLASKIKNLIGVVLLVAAAGGVGWLTWIINPLLLGVAGFGVVGGVGWILATDEAA